MNDFLALARRNALPAEFQALVREFPREGWDEGIGPFTQFYLERHELFRRLTAKLSGVAEQFLNGEASTARFGSAVSRHGSMLLTELSTHHHIEDEHYFPKIAALDPRVERAFDLLERDHHDLEESLERFQTLGNLAIEGLEGDGRYQAADRFLTSLAGLDTLLKRHLDDEEDIVVPLMLKYGEEAALN
ncbi:MAG: hemerythrin domain-containing protein [Pseudomonadota bacterium]